MPTSSAKPARLLQYRDDGLTQVEEWESEVGKLETALQDLREALSGLDLPDEVGLGFVPFYERSLDSLAQNQRHLDEWVGDVANEFIRNSGGNPATFDTDNLDLSMTVNDSQITVGYADRYESERQAREDAAALDEILGEYGIIHPYDLANDPELLEEMAEQYPELRDILARSERFANDESYAAELVNTLGPQNVRTMADLTNTFGLAQDRGLIDDDAYLGYVVPFAAILGAADRSGRMDDSVRDAIFDMDPSDEPPVEGKSPEHYEGELADMRYRSLALLVGTGDFSAQTTADTAYEIIHNGPVHPQFYDYSGFTNPAFLQNHRALASNEFAAIVALQGDNEAANVFFQMDRDGHPGELENLYLMNTSWGTIGAEVAAERMGLSQDEVAGWINEAMANAMQGGILEYPLTTGETYSEETINLVTKTIEAAGWEEMNASDPVRQVLAQISTPYTQDLAKISAMQHGATFSEAPRLPGIDPGEIDRFMQEVSESEGGRIALSQNAAALMRNELNAEAPDVAREEPTAFGQGMTLVEAYYTDMGDAWDQVVDDRIARREALVAGWQSVTDPVVDLVSGKIVEKVPVVNVAADLPLVSNVVDGVTDTIASSINDAVYNEIFPPVEYQSMHEWRDAIGQDLHTTVAEVFYENEDTRQYYLEKAQSEEPELYDEIMANGEVTYEEFMRIDDVNDGVDYYGREILDGMQGRLAFNEVFPPPED